MPRLLADDVVGAAADNLRGFSVQGGHLALRVERDGGAGKEVIGFLAGVWRRVGHGSVLNFRGVLTGTAIARD